MANPYLQKILELLSVGQNSEEPTREPAWSFSDILSKSSPAPSPVATPIKKMPQKKVSPVTQKKAQISSTPSPTPSITEGAMANFIKESASPQSKEPVDLKSSKQEEKEFLKLYGGGTSSVPLEEDILKSLNAAGSISTPQLKLLTEYADQLQNMVSQPSKPRYNLQPLAALVDTLTGSKMAPYYKSEDIYGPTKDTLKSALEARKEAADKEIELTKQFLQTRFGTKPVYSGSTTQGVQQAFPKQLGPSSTTLLDQLSKESDKYKQDPVVKKFVGNLSEVANAGVLISKATENKLAAQGIRRLIAKGIFGEVGNLSQSDVEQSGLSADVFDRIKQWWNMALSGGTVPEDIPIQDARDLVRVLANKYGRIAGEARSLYMNRGKLRMMAAGLDPDENGLNTYFPDYPTLIGATNEIVAKQKQVAGSKKDNSFNRDTLKEEIRKDMLKGMGR
jgi:hypothetical protein